MYSLDINFLHDRPEYRPDTTTRTKTRATTIDERRPLVLGAIAGIALPALALGALLFLQNQNARLEQEDARLTGELSALEAKKKEVANINQQIQQTRDETKALASVFNQIKPWSAMMQDIRDRIPAGVQIVQVKQVPPQPGAAPSPSPSPSPQPGVTPPPAPPLPLGNIEISGIANSFNDVNDFLLVLQKSNFLKAENTRLVTSELQTNPTRLEPLRFRNETGGTTVRGEDLPKLPEQVSFKIQTALSDVPASELLRELDRKGAAGLVTRIEELQRRGVIQQP